MLWMMDLTPRHLATYRTALLAAHRVTTRRGGLRFVNALGFCYAFTAGPGGLPGLFDVLATRSIDRMWGWAWQWKDDLVSRRRVYYGKVLRGKPAYVSLAFLPHFYALSGNVGDPDDALQAYREGRLSRLARDVYAVIDADGPLSTWTLRRRCVPRGAPAGPFQRALTILQAAFLIAKVGEIENGSYSFIWDTFARWMPQAIGAARSLTASQAAAAVLERYLRTVGAAPPRVIAALFAWSPALLHAARTNTDAVVEATIGGKDVLAHRKLDH
jgi:hypothetical protein